MYSARTGKARIGYRPSKKSIRRAVEKIHALTDRSGTWQETTTLVGKVNRTLRGWANYFSVGDFQQGVSGARRLCGGAVAPVVALQAQSQADARAGAIHSRTSTGNSGSYVWAGLGTTCRGRRREVLSESRMQEICLSGCVSSEGWHVQQGSNLPGKKSDPRSLDSKGEGN